MNIRIGKNMRAMLDFVAKYPNQWHTIAKDRPTQYAANALWYENLIEVSDDGTMIRHKPDNGLPTSIK